jgi:hypothetical protein
MYLEKIAVRARVFESKNNPQKTLLVVVVSVEK